MAFLKEQIEALWQQSSITNPHQGSENVIERIETNRSEQPHEDPTCQADKELESENSVHVSPIVPTANRFSLLQNSTISGENESLPPKVNVGDASSTENNSSSKDSSPVSTNSNTAIFLCDSNGKFLNKKKLFQPQQKYTFFRCPRIEHASSILESQLHEPRQLIVIHTGTNNLTMATPVDNFLSDLSVLITKVSTKFPKSKIIYSTLLPRGDIPSHMIKKINDEIIAACSNLPNVHLVTHDNLFS